MKKAPLLAFALLLLGLILTASVEAQGIAGNAHYVASPRGRVYYPVACSVWRSLRSELLFFVSQAEVEEAGYTPTTNHRCRGLFGPPLPVVRPDVEEPEYNESVRTRDLTRPSSIDSCLVSRVVDGDTLDCNGGLRIRLLLIDAPEMNQGEFGSLAKEALEQLASPGSDLVLEYDIELQDRYGRTLAYLWSGDVLINAQMIAAGMALVAIYPPNVKYVDYMLLLQAQAREELRGLWSVDGFECTPADYRAQRCR